MISTKEAADVIGVYARDEKNKYLNLQARIDAADRLAAALTTASSTLADFEKTKAQLESDNARLTAEKRGLEQSVRTARENLAEVAPSLKLARQQAADESARLDEEIQGKRRELDALQFSINELRSRFLK